MIRVENLHKYFGDEHILKGITTTFEQGKTNLIIGQSGSGKTVFLKCLLGLFDAEEGRIFFKDKAIDSMSTDQKRALREDMGMVFQGSALYDSMTVRENLEFPMRRHKEKLGQITDTLPMVMEALENVGLAHAIDLMPEELSGGMKRRIAPTVCMQSSSPSSTVGTSAGSWGRPT